MLFSRQLAEQNDWAAPAIGANGGLYFGSTASFGDLIDFNKDSPRTRPRPGSTGRYAIFE